MIKIVVKYLEDRRLQSENGANLTHGLAHGAKRYSSYLEVCAPLFSPFFRLWLTCCLILVMTC